MDKLTIKIFIVLCSVCSIIKAQERSFVLTKANVFSYRGVFYAFGFDPSITSTVKVYRMDSTLKLLDSLNIKVQHSAKNYSRLSVDSLHGHLQIYGRNDGGSGAFIIRLSTDFNAFELVSAIENTRLNSLTRFSEKKLSFKNSIYDLEQRTDSAGIQYFLNKYELLSEVGNYEYKKSWQFPFDKKDIEDLHIIHTDTQNIFLYVHRKQDGKNSQWLIKVSAKSGLLQKASKIGAISDQSYRLAHCVWNAKTGKLLLIGQIFEAAPPTKSQTLWYCEADSSGAVSELGSRIFSKIIPPKNQKNSGDFFLSVKHSLLSQQKNLELEVDLFQLENARCMRYSGTQLLIIKNFDNPSPIAAGALTPQAEISFYYSSLDKLDLNAKVCFGSDHEFKHRYQLLYSGTGRLSASFVAEQPDSYLLSKSIVRKNQVSYDCFIQQKNGFEQKNISSFNFAESPQPLLINSRKIVIGAQKSNELYTLKIYNW